jgi:hypothetical protein
MDGVVEQVRRSVGAVFMTVEPTVVSRRQAEFPSALRALGL